MQVGLSISQGMSYRLVQPKSFQESPLCASESSEIAEVTVSVVMKARREAMKLRDVLEVNIVKCLRSFLVDF